jgi:RimJ/RimL family protein N-acetyltransferase
MKRWIVNDKERVARFVAEMVEQKAHWGGFNAIGVERDGEIVAGIVVNNYNGANATVHIGVKGVLPRDFLRVCFDYLFNGMKLNRVTGLVPSSNAKALQFDRHIGFEDEFVMPRAHPDGDMHVLVMYREKCRWI